jgi:hypothetical protein
MLCVYDDDQLLGVNISPRLGSLIKKEKKIIAEARSQGKMPVNYVQKDEGTDE